ncbi:polymer-forming cytoskeletal protein [Aerophototrophica crusticola]|uniref:Polymer-forming cytoskeletal protein n=1 Tax=Aerophototrophica crusticola TaxID=1709002 RepID=A0A858R9P6_9PROT|nr:polymer-forming cytoskeletal protein [Rhodospirillaceae bacterium B3]
MFARVKDRLETISSAAAAATAIPRPAAGPGDKPMPSIIGPDMAVTGNLDTPGEVHVEGRIDGDVRCAKLNIGPGGLVRGRIQAVAVRVHGKVEGAIDADEVYLLGGSAVAGDIYQASLEIAPGSQFEGAVRRRKAGEPLPLAALPNPNAPPPQPVPTVVGVETITEPKPADVAEAEVEEVAVEDVTEPAEKPGPAKGNGKLKAAE